MGEMGPDQDIRVQAMAEASARRRALAQGRPWGQRQVEDQQQQVSHILAPDNNQQQQSDLVGLTPAAAQRDARVQRPSDFSALFRAQDIFMRM